MIQIIGGLIALGLSGWLLWDVSTDFAAFGVIRSQVPDDPVTQAAMGGVFIGFLAKMALAWALAITAGVLLS